ncbi:MAG: cobalamin biosynthesis protein CobQ [Oscillospiraceae bacterium]|nr:cobalamin biosynthesis protein CobQ [Oscillospiraceae bacterium]
MTNKKVIIIAGHYGSGKTNLAVNLALRLSEFGKCTIADLDIVNLYFRTSDSKELLKKSGITLLSSDYSNSTLDIPSLTFGIDGALTNEGSLIIDVGGDDVGAYALGRFADKLSDYEMLYVFNRCRYLTKEPHEAVELLNEIETACGLKFTAVVNNTNLGDETTPQIVTDSFEFAKEVSRLSFLPLKFTCVKRGLLPIKHEDIFQMDIIKNFI